LESRHLPAKDSNNSSLSNGLLVPASAVGSTAEATSTTATAPAAETSAAATATAVIPRLGLVNCQWPASEVGTVEGSDCPISFAVIFHFHEAEASRTPGLTVHDHLRPSDLAVLLKEVVQVVLRGIPNEIADIDILRHLKTFPATNKRNTKTRADYQCGSVRDYAYR
jgi:hypothetical protein